MRAIAGKLPQQIIEGPYFAPRRARR